MGQPKKYVTTPQKKNVWKPKSKMRQPKKVCNDTAKKNVWKPKSRMGQPKKYVTTPQKPFRKLLIFDITVISNAKCSSLRFPLELFPEDFIRVAQVPETQILTKVKCSTKRNLLLFGDCFYINIPVVQLCK